MKRCLAVAVSVFLLFRIASAHRIDEYLQATLLSLEADRVQASMRLIPGVLTAESVIAGIDGNGDGVFSDDEERAYTQRVLGDLSFTIDGESVSPKLISYTFPEPAQIRAGLGEIRIEYTVGLPSGGSTRTLVLSNHHLSRTSVYLVNALVPRDHNIRILAQKRNEWQSLYTLDYQQTAAVPVGPWSNFRASLAAIQFSALFHLGMRHIAEGTDHLLFLLVLLLPAPLMALHSRWGPDIGVSRSLIRILRIVTAFTIGHSITLTLAVLGAVKVPGKPVEILIALSIFVSAAHALRPIFPGKEALIAGFFGLIHGLAFAATLDRLGFERWDRVAGVLAFNLGIEAMQILVVAAVLPSLMLMSGTRAYSTLRIGGAVFAGAASLGWIVERPLNIRLSVDPIVNLFASHALFIAAGLFGASLGCRLLAASHTRGPRTGVVTQR